MNTKPVQVVMLPEDTISYPSDMWQIGEYQHLYFISTDPNEEIKEDDWIIKIGEFVKRAGKSEIDYLKIDKNYFHKIIASTDPSLGLPAIPTTWIRDVYVPSNGFIKEVRLETGTITNTRNHFERYQVEFFKVTSNNEVVIVDEPEVNGWPMKELAQTAVSMLEKQFEAIEQKSIDQELEDASNRAYKRGEGMGIAVAMIAKAEFQLGATWKAEQSANDAMSFVEWVHKQHYEIPNSNTPITWTNEGHRWPPNNIYTTQELYELWQQSK